MKITMFVTENEMQFNLMPETAPEKDFKIVTAITLRKPQEIETA